MPDRNKRKILVLTSTFPRWPGDREPPFVYELSRRLARHFAVHVLAPHAPGAKEIEEMDGLRAFRFRYFWGDGEKLAYDGGILPSLKQHPWRFLLVPFFLLGELAALYRLLKSGHYEAIHAHWLLPQGFVAILSRMCSRPGCTILCTSHGGDLFALKGSLFRILKRFVLSRIQGLTVVSRAMKEEVLRLSSRDLFIDVIPMGVDLEGTFIPPSDAATRIPGQLLFVGRLVEKKGLVYLLRAMPAILSAHPEARLLIAGSGPEEQNLRKEAERLKLHARVSFLGSVGNQHLPALYQASEIVAFPSIVAVDGDQEGFGLVQVEALGCECGVVATDLPAIRDIIADGETGLIVPQRNESALAEKIIYLLNSPDIRTELGRKGRAFARERYDWDIISERYKGMIEKMMAAGKPHG
ncbi:Glycosyltransferase involved in cell wall bisynthesis [Syntrophus gentianae]|uniref:Glycosyltransferase involved in cell wall bisynthesis n=1 Tax=Syntrophus gentianae TaxID=43775 RepID=A0A1H7X6H7_9BACT|nr:glycosyltransferase [Syntrophus gentianae]SEM29462.1 Glycosyltransferase involved in cell wall bisynthesis [Syntrophus gentianae]